MVDLNERRRTPQACLPCRKRKIKCNGARPCCRNCLRLHDRCQWQGENNEQGSPSGPPKFQATKALDITAKVSKEQADRLVELFFTAPELNIPRLSLQRRQFDEPGQPTFLRIAVYTAAALFISETDIVKIFNGESAVQLSERICNVARQMSKQLSDQISVPVIQANLIICYRELLCRQGSHAWMSVGLAIRMAQALRLGREYHQKHTPLDREIRRRIMWTCFIMDRLIAFVTSRSQSLQVKILSIQLPCPEANFLFGEECSMPKLATLPDHTAETQEVLPYFIKTIELWGETADRIAEWAIKQNPEVSESQGYAGLVEIKTQLQDWKSRLPPRMRWSESNYRTFRLLGCEDMFALTHFLLQHALCIAGQPFLPHGDNIVASGGLTEQPILLESTIGHAYEILSIVNTLYMGVDRDRAILSSPFASIAMTGSASVLVWLVNVMPYFPPETNHELIHSYGADAKEKLDQINNILKSCQGSFPLTSTWLETIRFLRNLYAVAFEGSSIEFDVPEAAVANANQKSSSAPIQIGSGIPDIESVTSSWNLARQAILVSTGPAEDSSLRNKVSKEQIRSLWNRVWLQAQTVTPEEILSANNWEVGEYDLDLEQTTNMGNFDDF